jgi:hypothetical protein
MRGWRKFCQKGNQQNRSADAQETLPAFGRVESDERICSRRMQRSGQLSVAVDLSRVAYVIGNLSERKNRMPTSDPVATSPERVCPLLNGVKIPQVSVKTTDGTPFELMAAIQIKPAVLVFYRGGW